KACNSIRCAGDDSAGDAVPETCPRTTVPTVPSGHFGKPPGRNQLADAPALTPVPSSAPANPFRGVTPGTLWLPTTPGPSAESLLLGFGFATNADSNAGPV